MRASLAFTACVSHRLKSAFPRPLRDEKGSVLLEFSLLAPVLFLIIFGTIELSLIMFTAAIMEGATTTSSRLGKTGYTESGVSRQDMIYDMIRDRCGTFVDMTDVEITSKSYSAFDTIGDPEPFTDTNNNNLHDPLEPYSDVNGNGQWDSDMGAAGLGNADDIVLYTVSYPWPVLTPIMNHYLGDADGNYTITSSVIVKNEPYNVIGTR